MKINIIVFLISIATGAAAQAGLDLSIELPFGSTDTPRVQDLRAVLVSRNCMIGFMIGGGSFSDAQSACPSPEGTNFLPSSSVSDGSLGSEGLMPMPTLSREESDLLNQILTRNCILGFMSAGGAVNGAQSKCGNPDQD